MCCLLSRLAPNVALFFVVWLPFLGLTSQAAVVVPAQLEFETELLSMSLAGGPVPLPLANGSGLEGSIDGYGFVLSSVTVTLSSQRAQQPGPASVGRAIASNGFLAALVNGGGAPPPIDPVQLDGQQFSVDSFFDVFFDITITDVDVRDGRNYAGQQPGASLTLSNNGPAHMQVQYVAVFDKDAPNYGLIPPPEAAPYFGHFDIVIPLGGDINGNGDNDVIKFTLATHAAGDANRTFITLPDGTVIDNFDSTATLEGLVADQSADPPFSITLTGPTTASSNLLNPLQEPVPEPSTLAIGVGLALSVLAGRRAWRRKRD